jgi:hypothetical protein
MKTAEAFVNLELKLMAELERCFQHLTCEEWYATARRNLMRRASIDRWNGRVGAPYEI